MATVEIKVPKITVRKDSTVLVRTTTPFSYKNSSGVLVPANPTTVTATLLDPDNVLSNPTASQVGATGNYEVRFAVPKASGANHYRFELKGDDIGPNSDVAIASAIVQVADSITAT